MPFSYVQEELHKAATHGRKRTKAHSDATKQHRQSSAIGQLSVAAERGAAGLSNRKLWQWPGQPACDTGVVVMPDLAVDELSPE